MISKKVSKNISRTSLKRISKTTSKKISAMKFNTPKKHPDNDCTVPSNEPSFRHFTSDDNSINIPTTTLLPPDKHIRLGTKYSLRARRYDQIVLWVNSI